MRIGNYLSFDKRRTLFKAFIESQFKYSPLVWMFYGRQSNRKINKLHERALRVVYNDYESSFDDLLQKDNSFSIHHQNIQSLAIQIYKWFNGFQNDVENIFVKKERSPLELFVPSISTVSMGENSLRYFGSIIWNSLPLEIRNIQSLPAFKSSIKNWKPNCLCRLCKVYVSGIGFVSIV